MNVQCVEIKSAADTMARHAWLWQFSKRCGMPDRCTFGEVLSAVTKEFEPF